MPSATRPSWDQTRVEMALAIARRSLCSRDQVGAVIVDAGNKVIGEGYNGPPANFSRTHPDAHCHSWCARGSDGEPPLSDYSDCPSLHAEANALMMSDRSLRSGGTIYVTSNVCFTCAKLVANSGLARVVVLVRYEHQHRNSASSYEFLRRCGLTVEIVEMAWEDCDTIKQ
jgi:dCMP deaminase